MPGDVIPLFGRDPEPRAQWEVPPPPAEPARYLLRIELMESEPVVWRSVEVASDLTMDVLHEVIQAAMGWQDCHLHAFVLGSADDYGAPRLLTEADTDEGEDGTQEVDVRLDQVLRQPDERIGYEYDFGDSWSHEITLEDIRPHDPTAPRAVCLDGARACPPEDIGGIHSHNVVVAWLSGQPGVEPDEPELTRQWLPEDYAPAQFSVTEATERVALTRAGAALSHLDLREPVLDMLGRLGSARPLLVAMVHDAFGEPTRAASTPDPPAGLTDG
ncbi:MAG TPA: plasmid pRiA4b ORF-3 family protein, partial [Candidatus Lustribacter sp.]|nr:plasmid pRiA4b ORF-3 family protein [Candidatus Lustribacter sp.]